MSLFLSFGVPPGQPLQPGMDSQQFQNILSLERRRHGGLSKASARHQGLPAVCSEQSFISFPQNPWNEAGARWCPGGESGQGAAGGAWDQAIVAVAKPSAARPGPLALAVPLPRCTRGLPCSPPPAGRFQALASDAAAAGTCDHRGDACGRS